LYSPLKFDNVREVADEFPDRSYYSITNKARDMGLEWKIEIESEVLETLYIDERLTTQEIADEYGVSGDSIRTLLRKHGIPIRSNSEAHTRDIDLTVTPTLAYIIGVYFGDGYCYTTREKDYTVGLYTASEEFAQSFRKALEKIGLNARVYNGKGKREKDFTAEAYSRKLALFLDSLSLQEVRGLLEGTELKKEFVKGIYESEGTLNRNKENKLACKIYSTDGNLVSFVQNLIEEKVRTYLYDFEREHEGEKYKEYHLSISVGDIPLFLNWINPSIKGEIP